MGMQDCPGLQVEDNGHNVVSLAEGKLIDGDVAYLVEFAPLKTPGKVILEGRFYHIPSDTQQERDMLDGGNTAQVYDIPLKDLEPPSLAFCRVDGFLQGTAAASTLLKMAMKNHLPAGRHGKLLAPPNRERMKRPGDLTVHDQMNPSGMTMSAPPCLSLLKVW